MASRPDPVSFATAIEWTRRSNPLTSQTSRSVGVGAVVALICLLRQWPFNLQYEEPAEFWARVPTLEPWAGYLQVWARIVFIAAHPFGDLGPFITRLAAAGMVGLVASYLASEAIQHAVPRDNARLVFGLSLALLPLPEPGPYLGPLNSQWWMALGLVGIALAEPRRWHYPAIVIAGISGVAPCLALPVFRDRRLLALLIPALIQMGLVATSRPRNGGPPAVEYLFLAIAVLGCLGLSRLPARTRLSFAYISVAVISGALITTGYFDGNYRYLAVPGAGIALGLLSWLR